VSVSDLEVYDFLSRDSYCCIPNGWRELVGEMYRRLLQLDPDVNMLEVKEKFGILRIVVTGSEVNTDYITDMYENISRRTCSVCGKPGKLTSRSGWYITICEECERP